MTPARPRVLIVDDEESIRFVVDSALRRAGFDTCSADGGRQALDRVAAFEPDVVVLDVMLPDVDGFEVLDRLRADGSEVPVVFLTARDSADDRIRGLTTGGDDYLVKPFAVAELVARVRLRLSPGGASSRTRRLRCADLTLDVDAHRVTRDGRSIHLSPTEFRLLHYLLVNAGHVLTRVQILDQVWPYDFDGDWAVVDTFISYLRRKIDDVEPKLIHTVRGVGFCLRADP